ncbi:MAG: hypothetical protein E7439_06680 [Ruminococcaceae bacterium]|nr:hypothetical protein [Oscillospiraceae bacterium]
MTNQRLYAIWAFAYGACAALSFVPNPTGVIFVLLLIISLAFFVPGAMLLHRAVQKNDKRTIKQIRNISLLSLGLTLLMLVLTVLLWNTPDWVGMVLHWLLVLVSVPMVCSQVWVVPLFGWACMLMVCLDKGKKK